MEGCMKNNRDVLLDAYIDLKKVPHLYFCDVMSELADRGVYNVKVDAQNRNEHRARLESSSLLVQSVVGHAE
jgi:hypothetical protein